jgi:hypothetical protein
MSQNVIVAVTTSSQLFPVGTVPAGVKITLANTDATQPAIAPVIVAQPGPYTTTFLAVPAGSYNITAQAVDASDNVLGAAAASTVTVASDVAVDVPSSVTVSLS